MGCRRGTPKSSVSADGSWGAAAAARLFLFSSSLDPSTPSFSASSSSTRVFSSLPEFDE